MRNRAIRPILATLSILVLTGVPTQAAPVAIRDVIQVLSNHRNPPELRIRTSSQTSRVISGRVDDIRQGDVIAGASFTNPSSGFSFLGDPLDQDPQKVEVVVLGDVDATICDCGDIEIPVGGFPRWPLAFLGVIPFLFLPNGDEEPVPPFIPPTNIPPTSTQPTPTPPATTVPEPATLLLFASGLAAFGSGMRRRFRRSKAVKQIQTTEED